MRFLISFVGGLTLCAALGQASFAQESEPPTPQHKQLNALAGTWDVAIRFKVGPNKFQEGNASCTAEWILDRHMLQQTYKSTFDGRPFTVIQFLGYDPSKKSFFEIKMDSMDPGVMHNNGSMEEGGKVLNFQGERIDPESGKIGKIRTVYTLADKDHFTLEWFLPGEDGKEEKAVTLAHTRKAPEGTK